MAALVPANLVLRFVLELAAFAAIGYWAWTAADGWLRPVLTVAAVGAVIVVWGLFVSPKAKVDTPAWARFAIEVAVWIAAGAALYAAGSEGLAIGFVVVAIASGALNAATR
jgi:hypothetical protein